MFFYVVVKGAAFLAVVFDVSTEQIFDLSFGLSELQAVTVDGQLDQREDNQVKNECEDVQLQKEVPLVKQ